MPGLVVPAPRWAAEYREALREAAELGEVVPWDPAFDCSDDELLDAIARAAAGIWGPGATEPSQWYRWWVEGEHYLARISLRFPGFRENADHYASHGDIGYDVRPSERGRGVATDMLRAMLDFARRQGYEDALVTCDDVNAASRRVIEKAGGSYLDTLIDGDDTVLRYRFSFADGSATSIA